MWDLNVADHHQHTLPIENVTISTSSDDNNDVVSNNNSPSAFTFTFDIMSNANDVASSSRSSAPKSDWLNLSSAAGSDMTLNHQQQQQMPVKKSRRGPRSRSSQYRGVTFYRRTGRWESHIWDCGKQVYLGGFDTAHAAARAYDRAAIRFRGADADINFNIADYQEDIGQMKNLSKEEVVHLLRRQTTGFARGSSKYRGVTLHNSGRWESRMGQLFGKKAYDVAALNCYGSQAATNFEPTTHVGDFASHAIKNDASGHDLDLSLSIDSSSQYNPKWNNGSSSKAWNDLKLVYSTSTAGRGRITDPSSQLSTSTNYAAMSQGPAQHSGSYFPMSYEVQSVVVPSSTRMPSWGWQHPQGHGSTNSIDPQPFTSAASSGFPLSSVNPISPQARQSHPYQNYYNRP